MSAAEQGLVIEHDTGEPGQLFYMGGGVYLDNIHSPERCEGRHCVIHDPSQHHMRDWPLNWRPDRQMMERVCPHGVGHPDPDDLDYRVRAGEGDEYAGMHGCDGCCLRG